MNYSIVKKSKIDEKGNSIDIFHIKKTFFGIPFYKIAIFSPELTGKSFGEDIWFITNLFLVTAYITISLYVFASNTIIMSCLLVPLLLSFYGWSKFARISYNTEQTARAVIEIAIKKKLKKKLLEKSQTTVKYIVNDDTDVQVEKYYD